MKLNKNQKFWGEFVVLPDGRLKVKVAKQHSQTNQYKKSWVQINSREFARVINKSELVIN